MKIPQFQARKIALLLVSFLFLGLAIFDPVPKVEAGSNPSLAIFSKKGIAGGATIKALAELNSSWFYNWGYTPGYLTDDNWDRKTWERFVPLFYAASAEKDSSGIAPVESQMKEICEKVGCNGRYYLIGNEPLIQDWSGGDTGLDDRNDAIVARYVVERYGIIAKAIKSKDPNAKLIILGMDNLDLQPERKIKFVQTFIQRWYSYWMVERNDPVLRDLGKLIKGWHVHSYGRYFDYWTKPDDLAHLENFSNTVNAGLAALFSGTIRDQEIWVTEFGSLERVPSESNPAERRRFLDRMQRMVSLYESSLLVSRYAWFYYGCSNSIHSFCHPAESQRQAIWLFRDNGGHLEITDLGRHYAGLGSLHPQAPANPAVPPLASSGGTTPSPVPAAEGCRIVTDQSCREVYKAQPLVSSQPIWIDYAPTQDGKLEKIELYFSGNGKVRIELLDKGQKKLWYQETWIHAAEWKSFTSSSDCSLSKGETYRLRVEKVGGTSVNLHRGNYMKWARVTDLKICPGALAASTPSPGLPATSAPVPKPPVSNAPEPLKNEGSVLDQQQPDHYTAQPLALGQALDIGFSPTQRGKMDRIELYLSGRGKIGAAIANSSEVVTEVILKTIEGPNWYSFDFQKESILLPGEKYYIQLHPLSGDLKAHRASFMRYAKKIYLVPSR